MRENSNKPLSSCWHEKCDKVLRMQKTAAKDTFSIQSIMLFLFLPLSMLTCWTLLGKGPERVVHVSAPAVWMMDFVAARPFHHLRVACNLHVFYLCICKILLLLTHSPSWLMIGIPSPSPTPLNVSPISFHINNQNKTTKSVHYYCYY